jgi:phage tail-like protein
MSNRYPPVGFHFSVEFDLPGAGDKDIRFQQVSGFSMELQVETVNEGGENRFSHKLPVRASYPDLVMQRGLLLDSVVKEWFVAAIQEFDIQPITVWVKLLNEEHEPLQTYTFVNAWPKKWTISDLNAETSALMIESMELAYQYFKITT